MKKGMIALMLSFVMTMGTVGGASAVAAELPAEELNELIEQDQPEEPSEIVEQDQSEESSEIVEQDQSEEPSETIEQNQSEESDETIEQEYSEESRKESADNVSDERIAQAIWTKDNSTLTFYYGPEVSEGGYFREETVTNSWSGEDVTNTGNKNPLWKEEVCSDVTNVVIDQSFSEVKPTSMCGWFRDFVNVTDLDLSNLDTSEVTTMARTFYNCRCLTELDVSGFDTSKVTNMTGMFTLCQSLTSLNVSGFDTSSVKTMDWIFSSCSSLTSLDVSGFDTSQVSNMSEMFSFCSSLTSLDVSRLDMSNVTNISAMFTNCDNLQELDLSKLDLSKVLSARATFKDCPKLVSLDLSSINSSVLTSYSQMFEGCSNLERIFCKDSATCWNPKGGYVGSVELPVFNGCKALIGVDGDKQVPYSGSNVNASQAKAASLGGYFTPKEPQYYDPDDVEVSYEIYQAFVEHRESGQTINDSLKWSFPNWGNAFPESDRGYYITRDDFVKLASGLSKTEQYRILGIMRPDSFRNPLRDENCWTDRLNVDGLGTPWNENHTNQGNTDNWKGSCAGMSTLAMLINNGVLSASAIDSSANNVSEIEPNANAASAINYYFCQQRGLFQQINNHEFYQLGVREGQAAQLAVCERLGQDANDNGTLFEITFQWLILNRDSNRWEAFGHTVLGYGLERNIERTYNGIKYTKRILVYDVSNPYDDPKTKEDERDLYDLYYNDAGQFCIPGWNIISSSIDWYEDENDNGKLILATDDATVLNIVDYATGEKQIQYAGEELMYVVTRCIDDFFNEDYAIKDLILIDEITKEVWRVTREGSTSDNSDRRLTVFSSSNVHKESATNGEYTIVLPDSTHEYTIMTENSGIDCTVYKGNYLADVKTDSPGELVVGNRGEVNVKTNSKGNLSITMVSDELFDSTEVDQISISGSGVSSFESKSGENGITIKTDNDGSMSVYGNGDSASFSETIENNQGEVLINKDGVTQTNDVVDSGTCGDDLIWTFDSKGALIISGTGAMYDYGLSSNKAPWFKNEITTALKSVIIKKGVTTIGECAFPGCIGLERVKIPEGITSIGDFAFDQCSGIRTVEISSSVESIGALAFTACTSLEGFTVNPDNAKFSSVNGVLFNKDQTELICCPAGKKGLYSIPDGVVIIDGSSFDGCSGLTSVSVPYGVSEIGDYAFSDCTGLMSLAISSSVTRIRFGTFNNCSNLSKLYFIGTQDEWNSVSMSNTIRKRLNAIIIFVDDPKSLSYAEVPEISNMEYTGRAIKPKFEVHQLCTLLERGKDYTVSYSDNVNAGTATVTISGAGEYTGSVTASFVIDPKPISSLEVSGITAKTFNGKAQTQAIVVNDGIVTLAEGIDYDVAYENNVHAGTASVVITGKGNYTGTVTKTFTIKKAPNTITAKNSTKTYSTKAQSFSLGVKLKNGTPTYKSSTKYVTVSTAGKVTVKAKYIGKATITITSPEKANYSKQTKKITITVNPTKTALVSVASPSAGKMTVKWKKNAVGTGYQIQFSTSSKFTSPKSATITKNTTLSKTIGGLVKGKKYYVRIRTYKTVGKTKFYSGWSAVKAVTIKK